MATGNAIVDNTVETMYSASNVFMASNYAISSHVDDCWWAIVGYLNHVNTSSGKVQATVLHYLNY